MLEVLNNNRKFKQQQKDMNNNLNQIAIQKKSNNNVIELKQELEKAKQ